jgi:hypothetical protein
VFNCGVDEDEILAATVGDSPRRFQKVVLAEYDSEWKYVQNYADAKSDVVREILSGSPRKTGP